MLILQSGEFEHFVDAARAVASRYAPAEFIALVREPDLSRARTTGLFTTVSSLPDDPAHLVTLEAWKSPVDLCVVPFDDRLGVRYFKLRRALITQGIRTFVSYNGRGRIREYSRSAWIAHTLLVCVMLRAVHAPLVWGWGVLRRRLDMISLYVLAIAAQPLNWLKAHGAHPLSRAVVRRLPAGRRRLVLFIPTMGLGGAQRQVLSFLKHLDRTQWEPELVTLNAPDKFFEPTVCEMGVPITYLNPRRGYWMLGITWRLFRHLHARPCHVLHAWMHYAAMLGAIAGTFAGTPIIVGSFRSERPDRMPWFYHRWQRGVDILTARLHTRLIANSNAVCQGHQQWAFVPEHKLVTIYNGIEADREPAVDRVQRDRLRADLHLPVGAPCIGIVGRLSPEKDHDTFLRAARLIGAEKPDARFLIVGSGPMQASIESQIEQLELSGRARILGERSDARAVIAMLDVLVLTSTNEGLPNVLLEGAIAGTPVVTTAAGGAAEVVVDGETGFVVPCGDADAVARRVLDILRDEAMRKRLVEAAMDRMRKYFSAEQAAAAIQACYARAPAAPVATVIGRGGARSGGA